MSRAQRIVGLVTLSVLVSVRTTDIAAEESFDPQLTIATVVSQLEQTHLSQRKLDEQQIELWTQKFLDRLDPSHRYFLDSDRREFHQSPLNSIELIRRGDFEFLKEVRTRYRTRVRESYAVAAIEMDTIGEALKDTLILSEFENYANNLQEIRSRWRSSLQSELFIEIKHGARPNRSA